MILNPTKKLSAVEALSRAKADTNTRLDKYRLDDHEDLKDAEKRLGQPMSSSDLITRVERLTHRRIWAEDSYRDPSIAGFYTTENGSKKFLVAFDKGFMPEFSVIRVDEKDLPVKEVRGWRTVLARLIQSRTVTLSELEKGFQFRDHTSDERWRANTRDFRR